MLEKLFAYGGWKVLAEALEEDRPFYVKELAKRSSMSYFAVNRFLKYFEEEGMLLLEKKGNLHLYRPNTDSPILRHLKMLFNLVRLETAKLVQALRDADPGLVSLVLYGSWSRGENRKDSDLDLVAISMAPKSAFAKPLVKLEKAIGAEIELHVFTPQKWKVVKKEDAPFYLDVAAQGILLYGSPVRV